MSIGPVQFEKLIRTIQAELDLLKNAAKEHTGAVHDTAQARDQKEAEIGASIADAIHTAANTVPDYEKTQRKKEHSVQWAIFGVTLAAAIFAAIAASGAWYYACIADQQLKNMNDTYGKIKQQTADADSTLIQTQQHFQLSQRPYIWVTPRGGAQDREGRSFVFVPNGDKVNFAAAIDVSNFGESPAVEVSASKTEYIIGPSATATERAKHYRPRYDPQIGGTVIPKGGAPGLNPGSDIKSLTQTEFNNFKDGAWDIFVVGGVRYRDIYSTRDNAPYETTYCFRINPTGLPFGNCYLGYQSFGNSIK
jgi:hypothetical protein